MGLSGTLDTMPVVELMLWLSKRQRTGIVTFKRASLTKNVTLENGKIVNAASNDPREYFGQFLINFGLINEDQLQKAFETQQETRVLLGKILVMTGLVSEEQVLRMLELKIRETFLDVFLWDEGVFEFLDGVLPDEPSVVHVAVDLGKLYLEGATRRNQFQEIRKSIPNNQCQFLVNPAALSPNMDPQSSDGVMLQLARQGLTVQDIILKFHSTDYPVLRNLHEMVRRGWLAAAEGPPASGGDSLIPEPEVELIESVETSGAERYLNEAETAVQQHSYDRAVAVLHKGLAEFPYDPDLCDALEVAEKGLTDTLRTSLLTENRVPQLLRDDLLRDTLKWTPAQRYLLSLIDGKRNLRSIIMVSPLKEVEALKTFHQLIQSGFVGLK
jgi:hypothetical protein